MLNNDELIKIAENALLDTEWLDVDFKVTGIFPFHGDYVEVSWETIHNFHQKVYGKLSLFINKKNGHYFFRNAFILCKSKKEYENKEKKWIQDYESGLYNKYGVEIVKEEGGRDNRKRKMSCFYKIKEFIGNFIKL